MWKRQHPEKRLSPLFKIIPKSDDYDIWLDFGSGDGIVSDILQSIFPNIQLFRTDAVNHSDILDIMNYIQSPPFRKSSIYGIMISQVLHYLPSELLFPVFSKLSDLLNNGGVIFIIEYEMKKSYSWIPYPVHIYNIRECLEPIPSLEIIDHNRIQDGYRPKFSLLIQKNVV